MIDFPTRPAHEGLHILACHALFASSTMIAWCHDGEQSWIYLLDHLEGRGQQTVLIFRLVFVEAVVVGVLINERIVDSMIGDKMSHIMTTCLLRFRSRHLNLYRAPQRTY